MANFWSSVVFHQWFANGTDCFFTCLNLFNRSSIGQQFHFTKRWVGWGHGIADRVTPQFYTDFNHYECVYLLSVREGFYHRGLRLWFCYLLFMAKQFHPNFSARQNHRHKNRNEHSWYSSFARGRQYKSPPLSPRRFTLIYSSNIAINLAERRSRERTVITNHFSEIKPIFSSFFYTGIYCMFVRRFKYSTEYSRE